VEWQAGNGYNKPLTTSFTMQRRKITPCPYCGGVETYRHGRNKQRRIRYKCKYCKKTFCNRTKTPIAYSKLSDSEWKQSIRLFVLRGGIAGTDLAKFLQKNKNTGQRINRVLRYETGRLPEPKLDGIVEADETTMTRKWIWGAVCRQSGQMVLRRVNRRDEDTLMRLIIKHTTKESHLFTDEWSGYRNLWNRRFHMTVNHSKEFVCPVFKRVHTNTQEGIWGLIKPLAVHTYRGIPKKHIDKYLKEFMFRYNLKSYNHRAAALNSYIFKKFHTLLV
jgi:transposase-like protein